MVGNCTGLVVALHYMSRRCGKCEKDVEIAKANGISD
jgi:hypothetical protein